MRIQSLKKELDFKYRDINATLNRVAKHLTAYRS